MQLLLVAFTTDELVPAGHGVQLAAPTCDYVPAGHPWHVPLEFAFEIELAVPAGHNKHDPDFDPDHVPGPQSKQRPAPNGAYVPPLQSRHSVPFIATCPKSQYVHPIALALLIDPAGHCAQNDPLAANAPAAHGLHVFAVAPDPGKIHPSGHAVHPDAPVVLENVPEAHGRHVFVSAPTELLYSPA